jgi:hypothetical protein
MDTRIPPAHGSLFRNEDVVHDKVITAVPRSPVVYQVSIISHCLAGKKQHLVSGNPRSLV